MKGWQYLTAAIAVLATAVLAATNVLAAIQGTEDGLWRWIMVAVSVTADLGLVGFLLAMGDHHRAGNFTAVFLAFAVWAACGAYTTISSTRWLEGQFRSMLAPVEANLARIDIALTRERAVLDSANQVALNATTQLKRDSAKAEADATRKRISELEGQKWPATTVAAPSVKHVFVGYEWMFSVAALIISQVAWFVTFGSTDVDGKPPSTVVVGGSSHNNHGLNQVLTVQQQPQQSLITGPRLVVDNSTADQPPTTAQQHDDDLVNKVQALVSTGLSQMAIAGRLGVKRWRVQQAVASMKRVSSQP